MACQSSVPLYLFLMFEKKIFGWVVAVHVFNSSTEKAETGGSL